MPALWGRKAGTDRDLFSLRLSQGVGWLVPAARIQRGPSFHLILLPSGWNGCASSTKNFFRGSPTRLARRVLRRLCRRSEDAETVRGRRKAETDRVFLFVHFRGGLVGSRLRASNEGLLRPRVARAKGTARLPRLLLRLQHLLPLLEYPIDRMRRTGIKTEATAFQAARRIELIRGSREPGTGRADRNTDGLMGATVRMADEVIPNDHHRFDSFKETLGKDLEHVSVWEAAHFHSFTSSFNRSFNSGICSRLLWIAPRILSALADLRASLSFLTSRSYST